MQCEELVAWEVSVMWTEHNPDDRAMYHSRYIVVVTKARSDAVRAVEDLVEFPPDAKYSVEPFDKRTLVQVS